MFRFFAHLFSYAALAVAALVCVSAVVADEEAKSSSGDKALWPIIGTFLLILEFSTCMCMFWIRQLTQIIASEVVRRLGFW